MSEENDRQDSENIFHSGPPSDALLHYLVQLTDHIGLGFGITLTVNGVLVSGQTVPGSKFFAETQDRFRPEVKESFGTSAPTDKFFELFKDLYPDLSEDLDPSEISFQAEDLPNFIHLKDVRVFTPGQDSVPSARTESVSWRGRIANVDGFWFGTLSVQTS